MDQSSKRFLSPLELVVTFGVLLVIGCLFFPSVGHMRERRSRRGYCAMNLKNLALAAVTFETSENHLPGYLQNYGHWSSTTIAPMSDPGDSKNTIAAPHWKISSWHVALLPYLDAQATFERWVDDRFPVLADGETPDRMKDGFHAHAVPNLMLFACPTNHPDHDSGRNSYVSNNGLFDFSDPTQRVSPLTFAEFSSAANGPFNSRLPPFSENDPSVPLAIDAEFVRAGPDVRLEDFTDGASNTILFAESLLAQPFHHVSLRPALTDAPMAVSLIQPHVYVDVDRAKCYQGMVYPWVTADTYSQLSDTEKQPLVLPVKPSKKMTFENAIAQARPSSMHPNGFNAAFADGQVRFVERSIDFLTYRSLLTPSDEKSSWAEK